MKFRLSCGLVLGLFVSTVVLAANPNTGGVHGPGINADDKSFQYRVALADGDANHRLHYQQAINDDFRWRVVTQFADRENDFFYTDFRGELLWHVKKKEAESNWDSGLRFDVWTRRGSRSELFTINWVNQWQISPQLQARALVNGSWEFGSNRNSGTFVQTRGSLIYQMDNKHKLGLELYNSYGKVSDFGSFDEQNHQLGPTLSGTIGGVDYFVGYLAGISDGAEDHELRLWINFKI